MKLGKINFYLFIFLILKINLVYATEVLQTIENLPSTFEEIEFTKEEEKFFEENSLNTKKTKIENKENFIPTIEIKALDKISAKTTTLKIKIGDEIAFENLKIKPLKCKSSEFDDSPDTVAYLQVIDITQKKNDKVFVFNGWTFSSSPSLRPFDHSVYDLWLVGCDNV